MLELLGRSLHRPHEQSPDGGPAFPRLVFDPADDAFDLACWKVVAKVDVHHDGDLVGRAVHREHIADADHARLAACKAPEVIDQHRVRSLADQQALGFIGERIAVNPRMTPMTIEAAPS